MSHRNDPTPPFGSSCFDGTQAHLNREIEELQNRLTLPVKKFGERHIELFCEAMKQVILDDNPEAQKAYLRAVISKITVSQRQIVLKGSSVQLAGAISEWTPDTQLPRVPIVVTKWRAWHDDCPIPGNDIR